MLTLSLNNKRDPSIFLDNYSYKRQHKVKEISYEYKSILNIMLSF